MNKSILWLLFSLLLLIIICVYQKSESIYQLKYPPAQNIIIPPIKEVNTTVAIAETIEVIIKKEEELETLLVEINTSASKTIIPILTPKIIEIPLKKEKEIVLLEELKASVSKTLSVSKTVVISKEESKKIIHEAIVSVSKTKEVPIDYLLSILLERDKVMEELSELITQALYNRRIAIENMNNVLIEMELKQKRLIKERDKNAHSIPTPK